MTTLVKIKVTIYKTVTIDNYEKGEIGPSSDHGMIDSFEVNTYKEALERIKNLNGDNDEVGIFDNRLLVQRLENIDGYLPNDFQRADFKAGKIDLYSATYDCYFFEVKKVDNDQLLEQFPDLEQL